MEEIEELSEINIEADSKEIDYMIKCRALFLYSVSMIYYDVITIDEYFMSLLNAFAEEYFESHSELLRLIFFFYYDEDDELSRYENMEWYDDLEIYLNYFNKRNQPMMKQIYDDIGQKNVDRISRLAEMFCGYVKSIDNYKVLSIKQ